MSRLKFAVIYVIILPVLLVSGLGQIVISFNQLELVNVVLFVILKHINTVKL
jgi:hypothetical protein